MPMNRSGASALVRISAAVLAALLFSVPAFAAVRPAEAAPCCRPASAPMGCCVGEAAPADLSTSCCLLTAPEAATPSLQSSAPVLEAPPATSVDQPILSPPSLLNGPAQRVAPRARSAPLFLLFAVFLV